MNINANSVTQLTSMIRAYYQEDDCVFKDSDLGFFRITISNPQVCDYILNHKPDGTDIQANRNPRTAQIERLEKAIERGDWCPDNGETIKIAFDESDRMMLIDGQHRLKAIRNWLTAGGDPVTVTVVTGMSPRSVLTVDTGAGRSIADFLTICDGTVKTYVTDVASAGRDLFRSFHNADGNPIKNVSGYSEGDMAGWLMDTEYSGGESVAQRLYNIREKFSDTLNQISRNDMYGNAGAKSWMTTLLYSWIDEDYALALQVLDYLASAQDVDLPEKGKNLWKYAREYCVMCHRDGQGFKAANKAVHDQTMVAYQAAWNIATGRQRSGCRIAGQQSFRDYVEERFWRREFDQNGLPKLAKVPMWPGG
jgi:hypothetical protein